MLEGRRGSGYSAGRLNADHAESFYCCCCSYRWGGCFDAVVVQTGASAEDSSQVGLGRHIALQIVSRFDELGLEHSHTLSWRLLLSENRRHGPKLWVWAHAGTHTRVHAVHRLLKALL